MNITVKQSTGTYIAKANGKAASCTEGPFAAARALTRKLGLIGQLELIGSGPNNSYTYRLNQEGA